MRRIDRPEPGYFKVRLYRRGPWVPARIRWSTPIDPLTGEVLDRSTRLEAFILDREVKVEQVWLYGRELTKDEYEWLRATDAIRTM